MRLVILLVACVCAPAYAQTEGLQIPEDDVHRFLDRQRVLGTLSHGDLGAKPLSSYAAQALLDSLALRDSLLSPLDKRRLSELRGDTLGGLFGSWVANRTRLYEDSRAFASVSGTVGNSEYAFEAAPLFFVDGGPVVQTESIETPPETWRFSRGARAAGRVGRFFFDTRVLENQARIPLGAIQREGVTAPRIGFARYPAGAEPYYDYFIASGTAGYRGDVLEARLGRDRNTWGYGRSSVLLDDYASAFDQLQLRWSVWRLSFQNLYARPVDPRDSGRESGPLLPQRYLAMHRLAIDLGAGVEAEIFETIVFASDTSASGQRDGFELAYLNPFQFYRATERELGSPDNALLGVGLAWQALPGLRVYGQGILDELTVSRIRDNYWGNKWAFIAGAEISDPWIPGLGRIRQLDLQAEYARLRPYIYSHFTVESSFVHYGDGLGHPAGPNASDVSASLRYRPTAHTEAAVDLSYTVRGRNTDEINFGADPYRTYLDRNSDDDVPTLQGVRQREWLVEGRAGVRLLPDLTAGAALRFRSVDDAENGQVRYVAPVIYARWGLPFASDRY
ncbi:MAG: hypothetical protein AAF170_13825 [Bacteroidota bacterium]